MVGVGVMVGVGDTEVNIDGVTLIVGVTEGVKELVGVTDGVMDVVGVIVGVGDGLTQTTTTSKQIVS